MSNTSKKTLKRQQIYFGCDPELFFKKDGEIIGAEKVLPQEGIEQEDEGKIIIDGVQVELNPKPSTCREVLASKISSLFNTLDNIAKENGCELSFEQTVKISEKEMDSLSDKCKQFGCSPSKNAHQENATTGVKDASKFFSRSAGGHIHIGCGEPDIYSETYKVFKKEPERLVKMLDIIVGNFCVMIDRAEGNKERRKTYGRAGEYRLPPYGLEYRTLSNFWLQSYTLMSLVMSLTRLAVSIVVSDKKEYDIEEKIINAVNMEEIARAINENDCELAMSNWDKIKDLLADVCKKRVGETEYVDSPILKSYLPLIKYFIDKVQTDGLEYWFDKDIVGSWKNYSTSRYLGWESFLKERVAVDKQKNKLTLKKLLGIK